MIKYKNFVAFDDSVQAVSNCNHCAFGELLLNQLLNLLLGHDINICSGFVKHDDFVLTQDGSANADKLAFSSAQICATFTDLEVDALALFLLLLSRFSLRIQVIRRLQAGDLGPVRLLLLGLRASNFGLAAQQVTQAGLQQEFLNRCVRVLPERVQVEPNRPSEKGRVLGNHGDDLPDLIDIDV